VRRRSVFSSGSWMTRDLQGFGEMAAKPAQLPTMTEQAPCHAEASFCTHNWRRAHRSAASAHLCAPDCAAGVRDLCSAGEPDFHRPDATLAEDDLVQARARNSCVNQTSPGRGAWRRGRLRCGS
jgi:hypothetical protein